MVIGNRLYNCPYCDSINKRIKPANFGKYRIKQVEDSHVFVFQCCRCLRSHRIVFQGSPILWEDMSVVERQAFKRKSWVKYSAKGEENGT